MIRFNFFKKRKEEPVKVLELFGGIGACTQAFKRVGIPFEVVDYVEIDKYACKSYNAMNGTDFKPQDICEWDKDIKVDFVMHGSPCQDFSVAGKGLGGDEGSGTRSSLMYETIRIVEKLKPKYVLWENVKNVTGKKHRHNFDKYLVSLQQLGYNNYWQIMNAKDYGIPQNRERVFVLSIRRDCDDGYEFPEPFPLQLRLKDMLDDEVDEKFYLSDDKSDLITVEPLNPMPDGTCRTIKNQYYKTSKANYERTGSMGATGVVYVGNVNPSGKGQNGTVIGSDGLARTITQEKGEGQKVLIRDKLHQVGQLYPNSGNPQAGRVYDADGISPAMDTCSGGNRMPKVAVAMRGRYNDEGEVEQQLEISDREYANSITTVQKDSMVAEKIIVREATKKGYAEAVEGDSINLEQPNSKTRRGRVGKQVAQTLTTSPQQGVVVDE